MNKRNGLLFITMCGLIIVLFCGSAGAANAEIMLDKVVAVVNAEIITWSELYKAMEFEASPAVKALSAQEKRKVYQSSEAAFLEDLINVKLMLQQAKMYNINAGDAEINRTMKGIQEKYKMDDDAFGKAIIKEGFTMDEYKKKLADQIITGKLVDFEVRSKVLVTDKEVNEYVQKNRDRSADEGYIISMILVKKSENVAADEEKARTAYGKIKSGTAFPEVAKQYSDDSSARSGGLKGYVRRADLSKEFLDVLAKLKNGEVSEPFSTSAGMHIIRLEEARLFKSDDEYRVAVKEKLAADKFDRAYKAWVKGIRLRAYVEIR